MWGREFLCLLSWVGVVFCVVWGGRVVEQETFLAVDTASLTNLTFKGQLSSLSRSGLRGGCSVMLLNSARFSARPTDICRTSCGRPMR